MRLAAASTLTLMTVIACAVRPLDAPRRTPSLSDGSAVRAALEAIHRETEVPGIAVAVVDRRGVVVAEAVGRRRSDEAAPLLASDKFHLGSDTKAMTAFLAARLVERGLVRWETTLAEAFPEWDTSMNAAYRRVRLADMLRHRAGIPALVDATDAGLFDGIDSEAPVSAQRLAFARNVLHRAPAATPGERFLYSNAGYVVAGAVLERRAGRRWEDLLRQEVFEPLRMSSCGFGPPVRDPGRGQPFGHRTGGSDKAYVPTDADNPPVLGPAGTVHCSLADWASFVRANMEPSPLPLVAPHTLALLHEPFSMGEAAKEDKTAYAMGWGSAERRWAGGPVLAHDGSNGRNLAAARLSATRGIGFLIAVNAGDDRAFQAVKRAYEVLVSLYAPDPGPDARPGS